MFRCCRGNEGNQEHAIQVSPQPPELPPAEGNMFRDAKFFASMLRDFDADEQQPWPEDVKSGWAESMQGKLKQLLDRPPSRQSVATIFRVPDSLRGSNADADEGRTDVICDPDYDPRGFLWQRNRFPYQPMVLSLGPYHGYPEKRMDAHKVPYRKDLLRRIWPAMTDEDVERYVFDLEVQILRRVPDLENRALGCYSKVPLETGPKGKEAEIHAEELAHMLILDACFVVEFLFKFSAWKNGATAYDDDPVIGSWWGRDFVIMDMLLLENQIPFFILQQVLDIVLGKTVDHRLPSSSPFLYLFEDIWPMPPVPTGGSSSSSSTASTREPHHLLHLFREQFLPHLQFADEEDEHLSDVTPQADMIPSATDLNGVGVTFRNSYGDGNVRSLGFQRNGTMSMPPLTINKGTGIIFRNLIAFEQGCPSSDHQVTSYALLMYALVNTDEDVDLLERCNVLCNGLENPKSAVGFFADMVKGARFNYHRGKVMVDMSKYWKSTIGVRVRNRLRATFGDSRWVEMAGLYLPAWWAELLGVYFKSPWTTIGIFTAFLLVILTVLQTVFAILPYVRD